MYLRAGSLACRELLSAFGNVKKVHKISAIQRAHSHILNIPYNHLPYVKFEDGIPVKAIREIKPWERAAGYGRVWSTSQDKSTLPQCVGFTYISESEVWVISRAGKFRKALTSGLYFLVPFLDKVEALRTPYQVVNGLFALCNTANKKKVDIYCILYFKWTDYEKSAFYRDSERNNCDAERSLQYITLEAIANEASKHEISGDGSLDPEVKKKIIDRIHEVHSKYTPLYGMEVLSVELRGAWEESLNVPERVYSLEPEAAHPNAYGDRLSCDYWGDHLEPDFFYRYTYGSDKLVTTPAVATLEWAIPSPPDFHHYNHDPIVLMDPEQYKKTGGKFI